MKRTKFYICKTCGNIITSTNDVEIKCCEEYLLPESVKAPDEKHQINIETVENDYYITFSHPMEKEHYFSFFSYVKFDRMFTVRLYPEQGSEIRMPKMYGGKLYYYCNKHGLFEIKI